MSKSLIINVKDQPAVTTSSVTITGTDGAEWVIRPSEFNPARLELLLVPGSGPSKESDIAVRAVASNRFSVEAVGW